MIIMLSTKRTQSSNHSCASSLVKVSGADVCRRELRRFYFGRVNRPTIKNRPIYVTRQMLSNDKGAVRLR